MPVSDDTPVTRGELRRVVKELMDFVGQSIIDAPHAAGTGRQLAVLREKRLAFVERNPDVSPVVSDVNAVNGLKAVPDFEGR